MNYIIEFVSGDFGGDGHDKQDVSVYMSSVPVDELNRAFSAGSEILGVNVINCFCNDYDDSSIPVSVINKVKELFPEFEFDFSIRDDPENDQVAIYPDEWVELIVSIIKIGNPSILLEEAVTGTFNTGGYGLFV